MVKVVSHLIVGLGKGGAETMLYQVLQNKVNQDILYQVISFGEGDYYEDAIRKLGIELHVLPLRKHPMQTTARVIGLIRNSDVLCCWMYHANMVGYFTGKLAGCKKIIWNIRHSELGTEYNKRVTLWINKLCAKLSKGISTIAYNGVRAKEVHEQIGYSSAKSVIVNNGVDTLMFAPNCNAKKELYAELGIDSKARIVLSVTRDHPIKDIPTFIDAFSHVYVENPQVVAVMCGQGVDSQNTNLVNMCREHDLSIGEDIFLLGLRHDVPRLLAACDLYVLHSAGEAFPNSLVQAMACGCVCVSTNVGDVKEIIADDDFISAVSDSADLAKQMNRILNMTDDQCLALGDKNRKRVQQCYQISNIIKEYENLYN